MMWTPPFRREEMQTLAKEYVAAMRSVQPQGLTALAVCVLECS